MFGADALHLKATMPERQPRDPYMSDGFDFLLPPLMLDPPWSPQNCQSGKPIDDFILIAEFSEQEGPRPVICIPKDGGEWFDKNEFSVKILSVDYQSSLTDNITEDAQVVMSDSESHAYAFVHHLVLNDIQARGYVRPFCLAYITADSSKIMKIYAELSKQMKMATRHMKYGNRLVFMRDLEKHLEDLSYTKAHLLLSKGCSQGPSQSDNDLLAYLNNIRQSMEEVKDIIANIQPQLNDKELEEKFERFESQSKTQRRRTGSGSSSLNDYDSCSDHEQIELSGSYSDRHTQEYSLFNKSKDLKPKLVDVSALRGKRRFDRSLRGLHSLCSWGAKEGLQRLRVVQEYLKRDRSCIKLDKIDEAVMSPDNGVLSFGHSTIGANFLSPNHWTYTGTMCCHNKERSMHPSQGHMNSFLSVDSFQSIVGSCESFLDDETMYSAQSSVVGTSVRSYDRQISITTIDTVPEATDASVSFFCCPDDLDHTMTNEQSDERKPRSPTVHSEFVNLDKDLDLKCNIDNCPCSQSVPKVQQIEQVKEGSENDTSKLEETLTDVLEGTSSKVECILQAHMVSNIEGYKDKDFKLTDHLSGRKAVSLKEHDNMEVEHLQNEEHRACSEGSVDKEIVVDHKSQGTASVGEEMVHGIMNTEKTRDKKIMKDIDIFGTDVDANVVHNNVNEDGIRRKDVKKDTHIDNETDLVKVIVDREPRSKKEAKVDRVGAVCDSDLEQGNVDTDIASDNEDRKDKDVAESDVDTDVMDEGEPILLAKSESFDEVINLAKADPERFSREDSEEYPEGRKVSSCIDEDKTSRMVCAKGSGVLADSEETMTSETESDNGGGCSEVRRIRQVADLSAIAVNESRLFPGRRKRIFHHTGDKSSATLGACLLRVLCSYNHLEHLVYSILSGRPVVVIATRKYEAPLYDLIHALNVFTPVVHSTSPSPAAVSECTQLKLLDVPRFGVRGMIRDDKKSVDYLVSPSVRRYVTLLDLDKLYLYCQPYQGTLLNFVQAVYDKKKSLISEDSIVPYIQMNLQEISLQAFNFYHCLSGAESDLDFSGVHVPRKSAMLELSNTKFLNDNSIHNSDCKIIKHLVEVVKIQQIQEEYQSRYLTDSLVLPLCISYQPTVIYKLA